MTRLLFAKIVLLSASTVFAQMGPVQVRVAPVESGQVEITQPLVASVEPVTRTRLAAEEAGLVAERLFDEGATVEAGTVLARLSTDLLENQRAGAVAAAAVAQASLKQAEAEAANAARERERIARLHATNVTTEKEYRDAVTRHEIAEAGVLARRAEIEAAEAALGRIDLLLRKAEIRSPIEGVVLRRWVEVGQWIGQGEPVADVVQLDPLFVRVSVPEMAIARVSRGGEAMVRFDALGGEEFTGRIEQILPEADAGSRTFSVRILMENDDLRIRPGFFARVTLLATAEENVFLVPRDALVTSDRGSHVVAVREGAAAIVPVQVGTPQGRRISVQGELSEGEPVVVRGNESLMPGMPVVVAE